jgi:hypothetical protein
VGERNKKEPYSLTEYQAAENHVGNTSTNMGHINQTVGMLVFTGTQISVVKRGLLPENIHTCFGEKYEIAGAVSGSTKTL